jgi:hypothetical protein
VGTVVVLAVGLTASVALQRRNVNEAGATGADSNVEQRENVSEAAATLNANKMARQPSSPIADRRDDELLAYVEHKYRYLLADVESAHVQELKRRLLEREGEANLSRRESTDARVSELLSPRELEHYQALKNSDLEQHHLLEYVGGIENVVPLDERQERDILNAKLRQKRRYAAVLRDAGLDRETLSAAEREYAHTQVAAALKGYLNDFLMEVAPSLTPEQYALLRNYEMTEFKRELERLQQRINAK